MRPCESDRSPLLFRPTPAVGVAPLAVAFTVVTDVPSSQIALDVDGNGSVEFQGPSLEGQLFTYSAPALYFPTVTVIDGTGASTTETALVQVYDPVALDLLLQAKWQGMKDALRQGDTSLALSFVARAKRASYERMFTALEAQLANIDQILTDIQYVEQHGVRAEYQMIRIDNGTRLSYFVLFILDEDGIWRLRFF